VAFSHQDGACPSGAGLQSFHTELVPGRSLVIPCVAGAQQGLKGSGFGERGGYSSELWDQLQARVQPRLVVGIPVVVGIVAHPRRGYSGRVWVWGLQASVGEGWVFCHVVGLARGCGLRIEG
jgi:hypothetical protein